MVDVTVRGAGIFGLACAWVCAKRGARVRVVDPHGVGAGASGGIVGALAPHVPENWNDKKAFQFESLRMSGPFWADVAEVGGGDPGYARTGRLQPVVDAAALVLARARAAGAADLWQGFADWSVERSADDWAPASASGWVIRDTLSARLHPRRACDALARALTAKGADIVRDAADEGVVLWATGWQGLEAMSEALGRRVGNGVKGQALLLRYDARDAPQLFADGLHIVPHADGTVAVGSTSEREFADPTSVDVQCDALLERAREALPMLKDAEVLERWAGVRPRARSRAPMLGRHPLAKGAYIANGGFKIGFGMTPKVAEVMADLMLEERDGIPEGFRVKASVKD
ncbi:NAD(P)/FAD-dependent oxidoreductase [Primorskyibacter flagellatus]|uniref:NAD(P)/FAD-dependent oxidoreductase n=1 Tax=Primorskyibacter flagellatus TaxID=1387277 RepID=UPI003A8D3027